MKNLGILVIFLGLLMTTITGIDRVSRSREASFDAREQAGGAVIGSTHWTPFTGSVVIGCGIILLVVGRRKV